MEVVVVGVQSERAGFGWLGGCFGVALYFDTGGQRSSSPSDGEKWRIGDGLSNNHFLLLEIFKSAFGPCNIFVVVVEEF